MGTPGGRVAVEKPAEALRAALLKGRCEEASGSEQVESARGRGGTAETSTGLVPTPPTLARTPQEREITSR